MVNYVQPVLVYFWWPIPSHTRTRTHTHTRTRCSQLIHGLAMKEIPVITRLWLHLCRSLTCLCQLWRQHTLKFVHNFLLQTTGNAFIRISRQPRDTICSEIKKSLLRLCFLCNWSLWIFIFICISFMRKDISSFFVVVRNYI